MLCCAVLCCAVLCCAACAMLCGIAFFVFLLAAQHDECMSYRFLGFTCIILTACDVTKDPTLDVLAVLPDGRLCDRSVNTTKATREEPRCLGTALAVALQLLAAGNQEGGRADSYGSDPLPVPQVCRPSRVLLITTGPATKVYLPPFPAPPLSTSCSRKPIQ